LEEGIKCDISKKEINETKHLTYGKQTGNELNDDWTNVL